MSISLEALVNDTRKLVTRLIDDEQSSDALLTRVKCTINDIQHIKQYSEDAEMLNEAASQRSQSVLVAGLQRESKHMRDLQAENRELRAAIDDYQNALELIMSKYRQQVDKLTRESRNPEDGFYQNAYSQIILEQSKQIKEMEAVMRRAILVDEQEAVKDKQIITQLTVENKGLREMCNIYIKYGRQHPSAVEETIKEEKPSPAEEEEAGGMASEANDTVIEPTEKSVKSEIISP